MKHPFPGMDPYLEHPVLWESIHARLIVAAANQLQPQLDPRYVASVEERVFIEGPQRRVPDVWIQKVVDAEEFSPLARGESDTAVIIQVEDLEIHESRVEILDSYNAMKLVALIEVVSPTNKATGPGRESYRAKQEETLARECHLIEIDLLRKGRHVVCIPEWRVEFLEPFEFLCCVSRWPFRKRYRALSADTPGTASAPENPARRRRPRRHTGPAIRSGAGLCRRPVRTPNPLRSAMRAATVNRGPGLGQRANRRIPFKLNSQFFPQPAPPDVSCSRRRTRSRSSTGTSRWPTEAAQTLAPAAEK